MKKLNKLQINSEKLMKDEELTKIRGGYGESGWTWCWKNGIACGNWPTGNCADIALEFCETACPDWTSITCVD